jgi:riboflavin kinase / FMN adenylyltransferase
MKIVRALDDIPQLPKPIALTIGTFDGVHLGHQYLLQKVKDLATSEGTSAILTFAQHPYEVLTQGMKIPVLTSIEEKTSLFEECGIDLLILLDFTPEFADDTYDVFIKKLRSSLPFSHLVLGKEASLGKNKGGNEDTLTELGEKLSYTCHFIEKIETDENTNISSKRIRSLIQMGKFSEASKLLGRPYTITVTPEKVKDPQDDDLGDHALLCAFVNQARIPNKNYRVHIDGACDGFATVDSGEQFQSDAPAYITIYTDQPLNPENLLTITFIEE